jgi:hypothetical protein
MMYFLLICVFFLYLYYNGKEKAGLYSEIVGKNKCIQDLEIELRRANFKLLRGKK